jgi:UDP-N-acetylmuramate dehydrogenase
LVGKYIDLQQLLINIDGVEFEENKDLKNFTTMRLKACGDLITVKSVEGLRKVQLLFKEKSMRFHILGMGANQLIPTKLNYPYLKLDLPFDKSYLDSVRENYILPASVKLSVLSSHATKNGLTGWEAFTGIPATIGGATFMNAGTNLGEIGPLITKVRLITASGEQKTVEINESSFSYRKNHFVNNGDVIYEIEMRHLGVDPAISKKIRDYLALRNKTQPLKESTCGCVFKNSHGTVTCRAGKFIDIMGLKGFGSDKVRISPKHANFMENLGDASDEDVKFMINCVKEELKLQYGVDFETEVRI